MANVLAKTTMAIAFCYLDQVFCRVIGITTGVPVFITLMLSLFSDLGSVGHDPGIGFSLGITQDQTALVFLFFVNVTLCHGYSPAGKLKFTTMIWMVSIINFTLFSGCFGFFKSVKTA